MLFGYSSFFILLLIQISLLIILIIAHGFVINWWRKDRVLWIKKAEREAYKKFQPSENIKKDINAEVKLYLKNFFMQTLVKISFKSIFNIITYAITPLRYLLLIIPFFILSKAMHEASQKEDTPLARVLDLLHKEEEALESWTKFYGQMLFIISAILVFAVVFINKSFKADPFDTFHRLLIYKIIVTVLFFLVAIFPTIIIFRKLSQKTAKGFKAIETFMEQDPEINDPRDKIYCVGLFIKSRQPSEDKMEYDLQVIRDQVDLNLRFYLQKAGSGTWKVEKYEHIEKYSLFSALF